MDPVKFARLLCSLLAAIEGAPGVWPLCARLNEAIELLEIFEQPTDCLDDLALPHFYDEVIHDACGGADFSAPCMSAVLSWGLAEFDPVLLLRAGDAEQRDAWGRPVTEGRFFLAPCHVAAILKGAP